MASQPELIDMCRWTLSWFGGDAGETPALPFVASRLRPFVASSTGKGLAQLSFSAPLCSTSSCMNREIQAGARAAGDSAEALRIIGDVVERFGLGNLAPALAACRELAECDAPLDVAVVGQFKSGKSSLLNALVGEDLLPVGAVPVTTVVTRLSAGPRTAVASGPSAALEPPAGPATLSTPGAPAGPSAVVTFLDGRIEPVSRENIADFVAEARNPGNERRVACVDIATPALGELSGLRLVDTPGLGSILAHNTQSTQAWLPHVAVALVLISADRPLSDEDRTLLAAVRTHAPRVAVILSKSDLLSEKQYAEVEAFVRTGLKRQALDEGTPVLRFSTRQDTPRWIEALLQALLLPVARQVEAERERTLRHKLAALARACREYLSVALRAAERTDEQRAVLKAAVLSEAVRESVIRDELSLTAQRLFGATRAAFEERFRPRQAALADLLLRRAADELAGWRGNLAVQRRRFEDWLYAGLLRELTAESQSVSPLARQLVDQAQERFERLVEAFRDRLSRNMDAALGITLSPLRWVTRPAKVVAPPIAVGKVFDIQVDLLWFMLPMRLLGRLFHGHFRRKIPWEVEKNLSRLAADWSDATSAAIQDLQDQALDCVSAELETLTALLARPAAGVESLRTTIRTLDASLAEEV
jgi:GTP-binding protein EngB required for normal cell division